MFTTNMTRTLTMIAIFLFTSRYLAPFFLFVLVMQYDTNTNSAGHISDFGRCRTRLVSFPFTAHTRYYTLTL